MKRYAAAVGDGDFACTWAAVPVTERASADSRGSHAVTERAANGMNRKIFFESIIVPQ
jgi:hypothetical protein